ncbi:hypothetical protein DET0634 [Dehalococcoides mccartyi 195]|uniref:Uncharacterized protein n=1 Tax=Dehalococcoides mccartyi (strain ATCC BAA-2266 / KCTC 15142 / 195) TaxID=243164 RepID=Q3Z8S3_DEHM1|nr:hypothetical protein DET0634 [Dehalococcoides mccartyi 195]
METAAKLFQTKANRAECFSPNQTSGYTLVFLTRKEGLYPERVQPV